MLKIRNFKTNDICDLERDVCVHHPDWVHKQLGTESEKDLQWFLDNCNVIEFLSNAPNEDDAGIFIDKETAKKENGYIWDRFNKKDPPDSESLGVFMDWYFKFGIHLSGEDVDDLRSDAWWQWHDRDYSRTSSTFEESEERCSAWVENGGNDGPF